MQTYFYVLGFALLAYLLLEVSCDHSLTVKQYCWECKLSNNTHCNKWTSTKVRCPEQDELLVKLMCFERSYNVSDTLHSERGCIRQDFHNAGYLCFEQLKNCQTKVCNEHLCNNSQIHHASMVVVFLIAMVTSLVLKMD